MRRGHKVSVLARDQSKLEGVFSKQEISSLSHVHIGDGADAPSVRTACNGIDVVLSGSGGVESLARNVAKSRNSSMLPELRI